MKSKNELLETENELKYMRIGHALTQITIFNRSIKHRYRYKNDEIVCTAGTKWEWKCSISRCVTVSSSREKTDRQRMEIGI